MKVLLTGAAGFAGQGAVEVLGAHHWLRCADIRPSPAPLDGETVICDLISAADAERAVDGIEAVVHMAMGPVPGEDDPPEMLMQTNVVATANLLWAARRAGIKRFVHMSSGAVIEGYSRDTYIHAGLPHKFSGLYCLTKSLQERVAEQYAIEYGMTIPSLRPWVIVDSRLNIHRFTDALSRDDPDYFGFVCRYDLAEACLLALSSGLEGFQPFHIIATEEGRRMFDVDRTEALLGWRPTVRFDEL